MGAPRGSAPHRIRALLIGVVLVALAAAIVVVATSTGSNPTVRKTRTHTRVRRPVAHAPRLTVASAPQDLGVASSTDEADVPMPKGLVGWKPIFADDFAAAERTTSAGFARCKWAATLATSSCPGLPASAAKHWFTYPDGPGGPGAGGVFEPSRSLSIGSNGMNFSLQTAAGTRQLVAALPKVNTSRTGALTSAVYVVRFHAPSIRGWDFVFNLWPADNDTAKSGYIQLTGPLNGGIQALVYDPGHRQVAGTVYNAADPLDEDWDTGVAYAGWHTAVIERTSQRLEFFLDGRPVALDYNAVPKAPLRFALQTSPAATNPARGSRANLTVSWVQIYVPATKPHTS